MRATFRTELVRRQLDAHVWSESVGRSCSQAAPTHCFTNILKGFDFGARVKLSWS